MAAVAVASRVADTQKVERKLVLITLATSDRKVLAGAEFSAGEIRFTPDGAGVAYSARANGADNVRIQPLDGSAPRMMTAFSNGRVVRFRWSPDGSKLAVLRERVESDVVLLRDGKAGRQ